MARWFLLALLLGAAVGRATEDEPSPGPTCSCSPACKPNEYCRLGANSTCACEAVE